MQSASKWSRIVLAAAGVLAAGSAQAVVVYSGAVNLAIPNTTAGLYVNVVNGTSFSGPGTFPVLGGPGANYDFNVFGSTTWSFFSPTSTGQSAPTVPVTSRGYVSATTTGGVVGLSLGTLIDGSSIFNTGTPAPMIIGFRFRNEGADLASAADDTVHFGWLRVQLTPGAPGTLIDYAYESTPLVAIAAGVTTVVPEPAAWMSMALGLVGLAGLRRVNRR